MPGEGCLAFRTQICFRELLALFRQLPGAEQHRVPAISAHYGHHSGALNQGALRRLWAGCRDDHVLGTDRELPLGANRASPQAFGCEGLKYSVASLLRCV